MAKIEFKGLAEYEAKLAALGRDGIGIIKQAVFEGADEVADEIRKSIKALPEIKTGEAVLAWRQESPVDGITKKQKDGLLTGLYLSKMETADGYTYTKVGFAGYNDVVTERYPKGQPNPLIARAVESGSSARPKHPFIRPAVNRVKSRAIARMSKKVDDLIEKTMNS